MIQERYCSYEVSKLLKEKGFNEPCRAVYEEKILRINTLCDYFNSELSSYVCAPTHQMAMDWLREEKRTVIIIEFDVTKRGFCPYVHQFDYDMDWVVKWSINIPMKYEEAVEVALEYSLEKLI